MKLRRHAHVAQCSTPALTEPMVQSAGHMVVFALVGQRRNKKSLPSSQTGKAAEHRAKSSAQNFTRTHGSREHDRSFTFTLSPKWLSAISETNAKELFEKVRDIIDSLALQGGLASIHPAFRKVVKHRAYPFLEIPMLEFSPLNSQRRFPGNKTSRAVALYFEARYECGDGSVRWLGWSIFPRRYEQRLDCIGRDITEAKLAADVAHRMSQMFSVSGDLFCVLGSDRRFQLANPAFRKLLGLAPESLLRTPFADIVFRGDRQNAAARLQDVDKAAVFFVARCGVGNRRIAWKAAAVPPEGLVYCVGREVADLRVFANPARDGEQSVINVAQLANDINNPLEVMLSLLFLLKSPGLAAPDHGRYIDLAKKQVSRIATVVRGIC